MENKRVFLAINIPNKVKEKIAEKFLTKLNVKGLKPVAKENLHLTMKFLGYLPEEGVRELEKKLNELDFKKFEIAVNGIGSFKKRVIWLGISKGGNELIKLNEQINALLELEEERFEGHLTIARNKFLYAEKMNEILQGLGKVEFHADFTAESLDLMESKLTPKGAIYSVIKSIKFS